MTSTQIRQSFLDFFKSKQHTIVPSSSLMPDSPNLLFTNAGMNQFVPIFLGQVKCPYTPGRAADTQKCIRAGGKHNDLDDVGLDTYHHTFFEMLGNWSFGDYFKREAIDWAWELVVGIWKFPPQRLYATVYNPDKTKNDPSEFDQEAWSFWAEKFRAAGLDSKIQIVHGNKKDNFWMMGETGPCGPCSELHVDLTPDGDTKGSLVNQGDARCIEIWNLVFIQFNANPDGTFSPLPAKHVDTGMGFERVTSIIQGTKNFTDFANAKISNYETDIFRPIFDVLEKMSGKTYKSTLPVSQNRANQPENNLSQPLPKVSGSLPNLPQPSLKAGEPLPNLPQPSPKASEPLASLRESSPKAPEPLPKAGHSLPETHSVAATDLETIATDIAFRVIADHIRTLSFAIADGIQPGIKERNGVLRNIYKRMVRYASTIDVKDELLLKTQDALVDILATIMGDVFPEVRNEKEHIKKVLRLEADVFNKAFETGLFAFELASGFVSFLEGRIQVFEKEIDACIAGNQDAITRLNHTFMRAGPIYAQALSSDRGANKDQNLLAQNLDQIFKFCDFTNTLVNSTKLLITKVRKQISDVAAFQLYDTYGFPLDLTELMARERGLTVDKDGFEKLMAEQRARARAAQKKEIIKISEFLDIPTEFVGYTTDESECNIHEIVAQQNSDGSYICSAAVDKSPLYAEMGGQVGDRGVLYLKEGRGGPFQILNTTKRGRTFCLVLKTNFHVTMQMPCEPARLVVDRARRRAIERHHTVTHLLHWALHEVASKEASQKGSFVGPDKLTFDFNSAPLTPAQVADIEKLVNERILENAGVSWTEVAHADVKNRKDVMQFFGDKYGDTVRVVQIGGHAGKLDGYSMELCGGTHTHATGEIGLFRIVGESAIAAGVRRIEAVAGLTAYDLANQQLQLIRSIAGKINSPVGELEKKVEALLAHQKELEKSLRTANQREAAGRAKELLAKAETVLGVPAIIANLGDADGDTLQTVADSLKSQFKGVIVLGGASNGAVSLVAAVASDFTAKVQAGKIIQTIAPIVGGKGGGKPDNARGGGKDASRLDEALAKVKILLG